MKRERNDEASRDDSESVEYVEEKAINVRVDLHSH